MNPYLVSERKSEKKLLITFSSVEEVITVATFLLLSSDLFLPSEVYSIFRYTLAAYFSLYLYVHRERALMVALRDPFLCAFTFLVFISLAWSVDFNYTLQSIRAELLLMSVFGLYLSTRFSLPQLLKLITQYSCILIIINCIVTVLFPSIAYHTGDIHAGAWKGVFSHRNSASPFIVLASVFFGFQLLNNKKSNIISKKTIFMTLFYVTSIFLVLISTSKTGLALVIFMTIITIVQWFSSGRSMKSLLFIYFISLLSIIPIHYLIQNSEQILASQSRDLSLTGRVPVWHELISFFQEKPFFGYGHRAFWSPENNLSSITFFTHAHNGLLEVAIDLGGVGIVLLIASIISTLFFAFKTALKSRSSGWPLIYIVFLLASNVTESILVGSYSVFWPLYIAIALLVKPNLLRDSRHHSSYVLPYK